MEGGDVTLVVQALRDFFEVEKFTSYNRLIIFVLRSGVS